MFGLDLPVDNNLFVQMGRFWRSEQKNYVREKLVCHWNVHFYKSGSHNSLLSTVNVNLQV